MNLEDFAGRGQAAQRAVDAQLRPRQSVVDRTAQLAVDAVHMAAALERIADMRDAEGNAVEMHRDELRAIARTALSSIDRSRSK